MEIEKKEKIYHIVITVIVTICVTFVATAYGVTQYYLRSDLMKAEMLEKYIEISDTTKKTEAQFELVREYIDKEYLGEIKEEDLIDGAVKGYVSGLRRYLYRIYDKRRI